MDTDHLLEVVPHYFAMLVLVFLVLAILRTVVGDLDLWVELAILFAIVFAYQPVVRRLGISPSGWE